MTPLEIILSCTTALMLFMIILLLRVNRELRAYKRELEAPKDCIIVSKLWANNLLSRSQKYEYARQYYNNNKTYSDKMNVNYAASELCGYAKSIQYIIDKQDESIK